MSAASPTPIAVAVVEHDGRYLVGQRPAHVPLGGFWEFPGGKVERGETPEAAAIRECLEETGLTVHIQRVLEIISGKEHPRGADFIIVYQAEVVGGDLKADDDADAVEWFGRDNLPPLAFRATQKVLESFYD